jgi:Rieske Fe-S protein
MSDDFSRREAVRRAAILACLPALGKVVGGCARRISPVRSFDVARPVDGNVIVPHGSAPELDRPGGAVVVRPEGQGRAFLVVNTGTGLAALQAECPHAACELTWVPEDRQAECPCHGSRFAGDGTVLNPPARTDLSHYPADRDGQGDVIVHLFAGDGVFKNPVSNGQFSFLVADYPPLADVGGAVLGRPDGFPGPLLVVRLTSAADESGIAAPSAVCTHLGCTVLPVRCAPGPGCSIGTRLHCPCHGSQFSADGTLLAGPAVSNLQRYAAAFDGTTVTISTQLKP